MNFVPHFNLFGIDAKQIPNITGEGVPTTTTEGAVGCLYMDKLTGDIYKCTAVENGIYTWGLAESAKTRKVADTFEETECINILNPNDFESGYYDGTTKKASLNHIRISNPIPLESGHSQLTLTTDLTVGDSNELFCQIFVDDEGNVLRTRSNNTVTIVTYNNGEICTDIPSNATAVLVWLGGFKTRGLTFANFALEYDNFNRATFEPYTEQTIAIKKQHLPQGVLPLCEKTIVNFGDSIFGNYRSPKDISTFIAEKTGATVHNCGFGGCRMASHSIANFDAFGMANLATAITTQNFATQDAAIVAGKAAATEGEGKLPSYFEETLALLKTIDFSKVDIITIAYGTNDFTGGKTLENESDSYDTTKFAGALRYSIETILNAFPHIRIFICSQTYRFWMDSEGAFTEDSDAKTTSSGLKLTDFVAKTKEVAESYHLPYVDNYYELGMNKFNRSTYFTATDGTHPNEQGRRLMAEHIAHELF